MKICITYFLTYLFGTMTALRSWHSSGVETTHGFAPFVNLFVILMVDARHIVTLGLV